MFTITDEEIQSGKIVLMTDEEDYPGILRVRELIRDDLEKVFGSRIAVGGEGCRKIVAGCIQRASHVRALAAEGGIDLSQLEGKREVYLLRQTTLQDGTDALFILGSDKRGTIYGLFRLSQLCGVSSFVNWADVLPVRREECAVRDKDMGLSAEPSVKYRGFFINDEWPAFGSWCEKRYGGFNAAMYAGVFELLLRLKGNYLWPAMWSSVFSDDGPGLASAELADELGIVMGTSHHEPCLRHGEEYKHLRGKDSIYGDAWNFRTNREGITRFWRDGLLRSGRFENVITVGMRGEADSTILPGDAGLADNISLLRDVLAVQNDLIRECVDSNLHRVPRMMALYKEVEPFFYGDENTPGLMGDPQLEGVTLMLCDDNHGNLRRVPEKELVSHDGGYGMYYHLDYHGLPFSYEWVNSTALSKIWDQMTNAYAFGIRELWIVNVGDIFTNEFPLSYFLNMAYDMDTWGSECTDSAAAYTREFVSQTFGGRMSREDMDKTCSLLTEYSLIANMRRPEAMNDLVYAPWAYGEREALKERCERLLAEAESLYEKLDEEARFPFYEFVSYPLTANLNLRLMWLDTTFNHALAEIGASMADAAAQSVAERLALDRAMREQLHKVRDGKWYGMGLSQHTGFRRWNEEECRYPVTYSFRPADKARIIALVQETGEYTEGSFWSGKDLMLPDFAAYGKKRKAHVDLYAASAQNAEFEVREIDPCLFVTPTKGIVPGKGVVRLEISLKEGWEKAGPAKPSFRIVSEFMDIKVHAKLPGEGCGYVSLEACRYTRRIDRENGRFCEMTPFGKSLAGMKAMPVTADYGDEPCGLEYTVRTRKEGRYVLRVYTAPGNPPFRDNRFRFGLSVNGEKLRMIDTVPVDYEVRDGNKLWESGVTAQIRITDCEIILRCGSNQIGLYAGSPGCTFEKLVVFPVGKPPLEAYLGPAETGDLIW